jgi:hypothetical protein
MMRAAGGLPALLLALWATQASAQESAYAVSSIPTPPGCTRLACPETSFCHWLQSLPLRPDLRIARFDGGAVDSSRYNVLAVVDMPLLFAQDLEQCADWAMRLWAEWHKARGALDNLFLFNYNGTRKLFAASGKSYTQFLKWAFANTNSYSLMKGCLETAEADLRPGDLVVQNRRGSVGHVSVVMDACSTAAGQRYYLMGYSFMPAQEFHIEGATGDDGAQGWFTPEGYFRFLRDNIPLGEPVLRRWP